MRISIRKYIALIVTALMLVSTISCEWDDVEETNRRNNQQNGGNSGTGETLDSTDMLPVMKVAVFLPLDNSYRPRFERMAQWALGNIETGTKDLSFAARPNDKRGIKLQIEWYDENTEDADVMSRQLAERDDIMCIIGPMYSSDAHGFGLECAKTGMNVLLPCTTSSEVVRKFASKPFFWSFAETDIRQCQVMLESAKNFVGAKSVSLLAGDSYYGQTFINWLPFEAKERGLELDKIYVYSTDYLSEAEGLVDQVLADSKDGQVIICAPGEVADVMTMQRAVMSSNPKGKVIFSDIAMDPSLLDYGTLFKESLGMGITADPASNFLAEYDAKYGQEPTEGECQFYDALVLMSLVAADLFDQGLLDPATENKKNASTPHFYNQKVSDALTRILKRPGSGADINELYLTKAEDINSLVSTKLYNLRGASGHIDFDKDNQVSTAHSTYQLWTISDGTFKTQVFYDETGASIDAWESEVSNIEEVSTSDVDITYPTLDSRWALLVAGSTEFSDYRHQSNVLKMYQLLKKQGYPDDHIILIMEDNIANNENNPDQGKVLSHDGSNLYQDVLVDYKPSKISVSDIAKILKGEKSDKLASVIEASSADNILVYWTGNGDQGELSFGSSAFTAADFSSLISSMASGTRKYRKMLWLVDASNAQSVTNIPVSKNIPGVLCINSSTERETSLADQTDFDENMAVYLSTHFTKVLVEELGKSTSRTYYDVYEKLAHKTSGSHVNVSNANKFDNLKKASISEFISYSE